MLISKSLPFPPQEQDAEDEHLLLFSLIAQSWRPLLRVTGCENAGVTAATNLLGRLSPGTELRVAGQKYHVRAVDVTHSGWAGISTWEDFLAPPIGRFFRFQFGTPLVLQTPPFALGGSSFPVPPLFFGNLVRRWQAWNGPALPADEGRLTTWLQNGGCIVTDYRLQGQPVVPSPACRLLGFLGHITYLCREEAPMEQQTLTALARFAFFAGSGPSLSQGLGATQVTVNP